LELVIAYDVSENPEVNFNPGVILSDEIHMTPSLARKLSFFTGTVALLAAAAIAAFSYTFIETEFARTLRQDTLDASALLSSRVRFELEQVGDKARILAAAAISGVHDADALMKDDQLVAVSLLRKSGNEWRPMARLTRPGAREHLKDQDFQRFDIRYPLDFSKASQGGIDLTAGTLRDGSPIIRMIMPGPRADTVMEVVLRQERLTSAFAEATAHFSFLVDSRGRAVAQTDPTHFSLGEDLSNLPIIQMAHATQAPSGSLDYSELPGAITQYGSFQKLGIGDLMVVSQAPKTQVLVLLRAFTRQVTFLGFACMLFSMVFALIASWGIVSSRIHKLEESLEAMSEGKFALEVPEGHTSDEIGDFSRTIQAAVDRLARRERSHGTFAKLGGEPRFELEPRHATVFSLRLALHGLTEVIHKGDPSDVSKLLNEFFAETNDSILSHHGVVDTIHGTELHAFWGIPETEPNDCARVLACCLALRRHGQALNERLRDADLPEVRISMGLDHAEALCAELGSPDRRELALSGEATETSALLERLTEQFGTDLLMTARVAQEATEAYSIQKVDTMDESDLECFELLGEEHAASAETASEPGAENEPGAEAETTSDAEPALDALDELTSDDEFQAA
jgi:class 3 adenylate cyclase